MHDHSKRFYNFKENGFAGPVPILTHSEAQAALDQVTSHDLEGNQRFKVHLFLSKINRIVHHPKLLEAVRKALNTPHVALWSSDINIKQPNSNEYYSAHQDATYTGLQPAEHCLTVWIALSDPVGIHEGCMSFVRRSHKLGQLPHKEAASATTAAQDGNLLSRGQQVCFPATNHAQPTQDDWVYIPLRAGEATLHHFYTVHQSGNNHHPTQPRVGLALRYMDAELVRQTGRVRECITWIDSSSNNTSNCDDAVKAENQKVRAKVAKYFDLDPILPENPTDQDIRKGKEAHRESMAREASNYFDDSNSVKGYDESKKNKLMCIGQQNQT